jgi:hypothetical protein
MYHTARSAALWCQMNSILQGDTCLLIKLDCWTTPNFQRRRSRRRGMVVLGEVDVHCAVDSIILSLYAGHEQKLTNNQAADTSSVSA